MPEPISEHTDVVWFVRLFGAASGLIGYFAGFDPLFWLGVVLSAINFIMDLASGLLKPPALLPLGAMAVGLAVAHPWFVGLGIGLVGWTALEVLGEVFGDKWFGLSHAERERYINMTVGLSALAGAAAAGYFLYDAVHSPTVSPPTPIPAQTRIQPPPVAAPAPAPPPAPQSKEDLTAFQQRQRSERILHILTYEMFAETSYDGRTVPPPRSALDRGRERGEWVGSTLSEAETFVGRVVRVIEGDTMVVLRDGREETIRLQGIDAPELDQRFGSQATRFVKQLALNQSVTVVSYNHSRNGHTIAEVYLNDAVDLPKVEASGHLNTYIVGSGWAWRNRDAYDPLWIFEQREHEARYFKLGLWSDPSPVPPWEFRKGGHQ